MRDYRAPLSFLSRRAARIFGTNSALVSAIADHKRLELLAFLNSFLTKKLSVEVINRQPGISMTDIAKGEAGLTFLKAFDWFIEEIKKVS